MRESVSEVFVENSIALFFFNTKNVLSKHAEIRKSTEMSAHASKHLLIVFSQSYPSYLNCILQTYRMSLMRQTSKQASYYLRHSSAVSLNIFLVRKHLPRDMQN